MKMQQQENVLSSLNDTVISLTSEKEKITFDLQVETTKAAAHNHNENDEKIHFEKHIAKLQETHVQQLGKLQITYNTQVSTYKAASNAASQEWHDLEYQLRNEKTSHLESVTGYRKCRMALTKSEEESSDRIAELCMELEDVNKKVTTLGKQNIHKFI